MRAHLPRDRAERKRGEGGAAAVEFALILPVLVMLLFGIITVGLAYADHIAVTNAVREGARYGAAADATSGATWASSVKARVEQVYADSESTLSDAQVCVKLVDSSNITLASSIGASCGSPPGSWPPATALAPGSCAVEVWAAKPRVIQLLVFPDMHATISANSLAYYGRTVTGCPALP